MIVRTAILGLALLLPLPVLAREGTDVIVMKNGDHITCEIKALRGGVLSVGPPYVIETISVDWSKVARVESKQLFLVKMEDGTVHTGTLNSVESTAGGPMLIELAESPEKKVVVDSSKMTEVGETSEKFFQRFTGGVGFGVLYSKGNSSTQYSLNGLAAYPRARWSAQLGLSSTLTHSKGVSASTSCPGTITLSGVLAASCKARSKVSRVRPCSVAAQAVISRTPTAPCFMCSAASPG